jgi:hypothetical protein
MPGRNSQSHPRPEGCHPSTNLAVLQVAPEAETYALKIFGKEDSFETSDLARATAKDPVEPFIDPEGYRAYIDDAAAKHRRGFVH